MIQISFNWNKNFLIHKHKRLIKVEAISMTLIYFFCLGYSKVKKGSRLNFEKYASFQKQGLQHVTFQGFPSGKCLPRCFGIQYGVGNTELFGGKDIWYIHGICYTHSISIFVMLRFCFCLDCCEMWSKNQRISYCSFHFTVYQSL